MVYLAKKDGGAVHHTSLKALKELDGIEAPDLEVSDEQFEAAGGLVRIIKGKIVLGRTEAETLNAEKDSLQKELGGTDYKVIKAYESGQSLEKTDPELYERRNWCRDRINEIQARLGELKAV
jgi:hypothetical protein